MENEIRVIPFKSVNGVGFGTNRQELRKKFGEPISSFQKSPDDKVDTDEYDFFHVFYDDNYNFEAIEIFGLDEAELYFDNKKVPFSYSEVLEFFRSFYGDIEEDDAGFISYEGSVGVYIENDEDETDSILFGRKDYYGELL